MKYTWTVAILICLTLIPCGLRAEETLNQPNWPRTISHGSSDDLTVAFTFDDAPMPDGLALLDVLEQLDIHATFFVEGAFVSKRPDLLREIDRRGHEIGNHTYDHPNMKHVGDPERTSQLDRTNQLVQQTIGKTPHLFRPPGGNYNTRTVDIAYSMQMTTVMWNVCCEDYRDPSTAYIVSHVLSAVRPGSIILLHDGVKNTREALPEIVNTLRNRGYRFVTVGEMLGEIYGPCPWDSAYGLEIPDPITFPPVF
jgi:peptidoglycan/xylan/chitin deacetylase (PgdA/CDA1 family)